MKTHYPNESYRNAYKDIQKGLEKFGFKRQQKSVYFAKVDEIDIFICAKAVKYLDCKYEWFRPSISDIRMLRIIDNGDLKSVLDW